MAKGLSLNIGVNELKKGFYSSNGRLDSPENDAKAMAAIATMEGYKSPIILLTQQATKDNFLHHLNNCINELEAGDTFLLSFSGHGGQIIDKNGDEAEGLDETWCMHDQHIVDDEIYNNLKKFSKDVKIIIVSSSCHSRTTIKDLGNLNLWTKSCNTNHSLEKNALLTKKTVHSKHEFDPLILADIIHISACRDNQIASAGKYFTRFTDLLLKNWDYGRFMGTYEELVYKIHKESGYSQKPGVRTLGSNTPYLQNKIPFKLY